MSFVSSIKSAYTYAASRPTIVSCSGCDLQLPVPPNAYDWKCEAGHENLPDEAKCRVCERKPAEWPTPTVRCIGCNTMTSVPWTNASKTVWEAGRAAKKQADILTSRPTRAFHCHNCNSKLMVPTGPWICHTCAENNVEDAKNCSRCKQSSSDQKVICGVCGQSTQVKSMKFVDTVSANFKRLSSSFTKAYYDVSGTPYITCPRCTSHVDLSSLPREAQLQHSGASLSSGTSSSIAGAIGSSISSLASSVSSAFSSKPKTGVCDSCSSASCTSASCSLASSSSASSMSAGTASSMVGAIGSSISSLASSVSASVSSAASSVSSALHSKSKSGVCESCSSASCSSASCSAASSSISDSSASSSPMSSSSMSSGTSSSSIVGAIGSSISSLASSVSSSVSSAFSSKPKLERKDEEVGPQTAPVTKEPGMEQAELKQQERALGAEEWRPEHKQWDDNDFHYIECPTCHLQLSYTLPAGSEFDSSAGAGAAGAAAGARDVDARREEHREHDEGFRGAGAAPVSNFGSVHAPADSASSLASGSSSSLAPSGSAAPLSNFGSVHAPAAASDSASSLGSSSLSPDVGRSAPAS